MIQRMLAIWSLVPLPLLKPAWTSQISWFMYCWSLAWIILSITFLLYWGSVNPTLFNHRCVDVFLWLERINTVKRDFLCFSSLPLGHISWYSFRCSLCITDIHNIIHICVLIFLYLSIIYQHFPGSSIGKESSRRARDLGLIPGWGWSSGEGNGNQV